MKKYIYLMLLPLVAGILLSPLQHAEAVTGASWRPGRIIDDALFTNKSAMSVAQIQAFIDSKAPTCDTYGQKAYSSTQTRAQRAAQKGNPAPTGTQIFTCLKDYYEVSKTSAGTVLPASNYGYADPLNHIPVGAQSAAQLIWNAAQAYDISPQVLLITLQKEQGLLTDDWPLYRQYMYAMGADCPDGPNGAQCDPNYAGFSIQMRESAALLRAYLTNMTQPWWLYKKPFQNNSILWQDVNTKDCGASNVYIETMATAALYTYTPYQPNTAALENLYGDGDSCSAYGNRNFWVYYNDWFGPTVNDGYSWEVIADQSNGIQYLVVGRSKYRIPGPSIKTAWGLDSFSYRTVGQTFLDGLGTGPNLNYVALDVNGTRYLMSGGQHYRLTSDKYVLAWGVAGVPHIFAPGVLAQTPSGGDIGRFATDSSSGQTYLMDGTMKYAGLTSQSLGYWGQAASNTTTVTSDVIAHLPTGAAIDRYANVNQRDYIIDQGKLLGFSRSEYENAWGSHNYATIPNYASALMPQSSLGNFAYGPEGKWYYLEGSNKHYVSALNLATVWGWSTANSVTAISADLLSTLTPGPNLTYYAQDPANNLYVVDGAKHLVISSAMQSAWLPASATIPTFSSQSLGLLNSGANASGIINPNNTPNLYTIESGYLRYVPTYNTLDAWGFNRNQPSINIKQELVKLLPTKTAVSIMVKTSDNSLYYLENGYKWQIDQAFVNAWQINSASLVDATTLDRFDTKTPKLTTKVVINGKNYLIDKGAKIDVGKYDDIYQVSSGSPVNISRDYFPSRTASYLVGSSGGDGRIWLLSDGKRYYVDSFNRLLDLGSGVPITQMSTDNLNLYPVQPAVASRLIRGKNTGALFLSTARGFGFKSSSDLAAYNGSSDPLLTVSDSIFNSFSLVGWASTITYSNGGKVYLVENGQLRWITSPAVLNSQYNNVQWLFLPQSTINAFPLGENVSN